MFFSGSMITLPRSLVAETPQLLIDLNQGSSLTFMTLHTE